MPGSPGRAVCSRDLRCRCEPASRAPSVAGCVRSRWPQLSGDVVAGTLGRQPVCRGLVRAQRACDCVGDPEVPGCLVIDGDVAAGANEIDDPNIVARGTGPPRCPVDVRLVEPALQVQYAEPGPLVGRLKQSGRAPTAIDRRDRPGPQLHGSDHRRWRSVRPRSALRALDAAESPVADSVKGGRSRRRVPAGTAGDHCSGWRQPPKTEVTCPN